MTSTSDNEDMSLAIPANRVAAVLLSDGWHPVAPDTFTLDAYEFLESEAADSFLLHGGGRSGICSTGFAFRQPDGAYIVGPLTSILAVQQLDG